LTYRVCIGRENMHQPVFKHTLAPVPGTIAEAASQ
jgi:hypothetical protein